MRVSIVSAVYNEKNITDTVNHWIDYFIHCKEVSAFEIILCDDCSDINYFRNLKKYTEQTQFVSLLRNKANEGPGYSFSRCFRSVNYEFTLITDSDGQFPIHNFDQILNAYKKQKSHDIVIFTHRNIKHDNKVNVFGQKASNFLCNYIYKSKLNDFTCAFKFVSTKHLQNTCFDAKYMNYSLDHTAKLIETQTEYRDIPIICEENEAPKRGIKKEFTRAFDRLLYIYYLWYRKYLLNKRVLFHHNNE